MHSVNDSDIAAKDVLELQYRDYVLDIGESGQGNMIESGEVGDNGTQVQLDDRGIRK